LPLQECRKWLPQLLLPPHLFLVVGATMSVEDDREAVDSEVDPLDAEVAGVSVDMVLVVLVVVVVVMVMLWTHRWD
jgi:hypothetical protein